MSEACPFVWYDVMTPDLAGAEAFYTRAIGWTGRDGGMSGAPYTVFSAGDIMVGGAMPLPEEARAMGAPPAWTGYVGVPDVDDYAARVTQAGGTLMRPASDIPGVGRFAVVADPQGAVFILFRGMQGAMPTPDPTSPGRIGWHELHADDVDGVWPFYESLFGWRKTEALDMGAMGAYQMFATGGDSVGGMMKRASPAPRAFWLYYWTVDAIDAAIARVTGAGGSLAFGPQEVPGGLFVAQCQDPHGAYFGMVAARR